jgi:molybdenum cofactor cytidylyltransferase
MSALIPARFGFVTKAVQGVGITFTDLHTGDSFFVANYSLSLGKMVADPFALDRAKNCIEAAISLSEQQNCPLYFDEIGYVEGDHAPFLNAINKAFDTRPVYAVLRKSNCPHIQKILSRTDVCAFDMTAKEKKLGCVVMASGISKRFGKNKLLEEFKGNPLASYAVENANQNVFDKSVLLTRLDGVEEEFRSKIKVVRHELPTRGEALSLGIKLLNDMDGVMFLQADQPLVSRDSIINLATAFWQNPERCYRLSFGEKQGAPIIFPKRVFAKLMQTGGKGGHTIFNESEKPVPIFAEREIELFDVDTKEDLENLKKLMG